MDPITQGTLGATLSESFSDKRKVKVAALLGCFAGLSADIDVLIQWPSDPLLFLEFHRQFTHSLVFIPVGALICAALAWKLAKKHLNFKETYQFCLLGYATHGLLDACTTYGTQLFWPFSNMRVAWNTISIVDPLFTLPVLTLVVLGVTQQKPMFARLALAWVFVYLSLGLIQRDRAIAAGFELARTRGHTPVRLEAKPGFGNLVLWKVIYEAEDVFHVDAIRVGITAKIMPGDQIEILNIEKHFPWLDTTSQQAKDIERFRWFSRGYLALDQSDPNRIIDIRYSVLPNEISALWAIELDPDAGPQAHVRFTTRRSASWRQLSSMVEMLID
jgi:inner membrane protein